MKSRSTTMLAAAIAAFATLAAGSALADPWEREHPGWGHHKHHRDWDGPRVVYAAPPPPRVVYAPPPRVVYAPPPVVYAAPPVMYEPASPSINFVFPLR
ncbi:MAG: hypothetical protein ACM3Q1_05275 [Bacteroidales bacterium]